MCSTMLQRRIMKITPTDKELASRFPLTASTYGYGMSMAEAKISPAQLDRLLKLNLIKIATNLYCGGGLNDKPAKGSFLRHVTTFLRNVN